MISFTASPDHDAKERASLYIEHITSALKGVRGKQALVLGAEIEDTKTGV
jgi:hypothetical protein